MMNLASRIKRIEAEHAPAAKVHCFTAGSDEEADRVQGEMTAAGKVGL